MANAPHSVVLSDRDLALLAVLDKTPATSALLLKASHAFPGDRFLDERRVRERLQALNRAGLVRSFPTPHSSQSIRNVYKLTAEGFRLARGIDAALPHKSYFGPIAPSRLRHTEILAELIVHTLVAAHRSHTAVTGFHRENELTLGAAGHEIKPDSHVQLSFVGRTFNFLYELDLSTESVDSSALTAIRSKIEAYEAYQDQILAAWKMAGERGSRPAFRVVFFTRSAERTEHILSLAQDRSLNPDRRLCYSAPYDAFLSDERALQSPLFLDHASQWRALMTAAPTASFQLTPVRLRRPLTTSLAFC
jgi:hypothetical protein